MIVEEGGGVVVNDDREKVRALIHPEQSDRKPVLYDVLFTERLSRASNPQKTKQDSLALVHSHLQEDLLDVTGDEDVEKARAKEQRGNFFEFRGTGTDAVVEAEAVFHFRRCVVD